MKPVSERHVDELLKLGSILILDKTLWSASYLHDLICRKPANVSTTIGNKTLPTELWLQILSWFQVRPRSHDYMPGYVVGIGSVQNSSSRQEPALICNRLKEWRKCGQLRNSWIVNVYEEYLNNPSYIPTEDEILNVPFRYEEEENFSGSEIMDKAECPFEVTKTAEDSAILIPISHLKFETKFLFRLIKVPDMISFLENGDCHLCRGNRWRDYCCPNGTEELEYHCSTVMGHMWCMHDLLCPLCMGSHNADMSIELSCDKDEEPELTGKEFAEWEEERLAELGYEFDADTSIELSNDKDEESELTDKEFAEWEEERLAELDCEFEGDDEYSAVGNSITD
ncbi:cuticle-degrading protease [Fusarium heterosporum]|uniref:Cuticle-degrading protease n=1 Tax=Fusarium heterosporum TaxID=42747 RepID=A0A8H5WGC1_FUSHE|nr:cuticle-degrading protease [Fusarium heterosporum]